MDDLITISADHEKASNSSGTRLMCNGHYCTGKEVRLPSMYFIMTIIMFDWIESD